MTPTNILACVKAAARRGWPVFPISPGRKGPPRVRDWERAASTDPDQIHAWWKQWPAANYGIACGPAHLVVVDLDVPKPGQLPPPEWDLPGVLDGADVFAVLAERARWRYRPDDTFTVRTRRGGLHLYFTHPTGDRLTNTAGERGGLGWKIDTRAHGGYVVGPGSFVDESDGAGAYTPLNRALAAPLPAWLVDLLRPAPLPPQRPVAVPLVAHDRRSAYLRSAVTDEIRRVTQSPPHGHNNALYQASVALGQLVAGGELTEHEVTGWLSEAAARVGQKPREIPKTIASGLRAGAKRPRKVAA
ncbi:bifunctional DNA primase/polymerase [Nocardiopsis sp. NPDC049922]|uniref:bifunctional DNA primase/polymerase n=1 Tax=Nocardiopsis sp. NPDC049922 TaxID=3155157 RepID=UPI003400E554